MTFGIRRVTHALLAALIVLAPFGTRLILDVAHAKGVPVEASTYSLFMTQLVAVAVICAVFRRPRRAWGRFAFPERAAIVLVALAGFASAFSSDPYHSMALTLRLALGVLLFLAVSRIDVPVKTVMWALLVMAALQGGIALLQAHSQRVIADTAMGVASQVPADLGTSVVETGDGRWLRAYGTLPHPNLLGFFAAIGALAGAWLTVELSVTYAAVTFLCLSSLGMMLSFSRSAIIAFVAGTTALIADGWFRPAVRARYVVAALVVALTVIGAIAAVPEAWVTRTSLDGRLETMSLDARQRSLEDGMALVAASPVLGVGPGLSQQAIGALHPERDGWTLEPPHLVPLVIAAEAGVPAMLAWLLCIGSLLVAACRSLRRPSVAPLAAVLFAVVPVALLDHYFWTVWPGQLVFWLVCGVFWAEVQRTHAPPKNADGGAH